MADFYKSVPSELGPNLEYRMNLRAKAQKDAGLRRAIMAACKHDILYFLRGWCFLHEPRARFDSRGKLLPKVFPFLTWPHQDREFVRVREALGVRNIVVEKCRGEGWTWFGCLAALQDWLFSSETSVGLVSSTEEKSDSPGNMGSIMAKIDWELTKLPTWMTGVKGRDRNSGGDWYRNLSGHSLVNMKHGNQINAFAASPDTGRGDRFTWFLLDEHGSDDWKKENKDERVLEALGGTTDSILSISTPKGAYGAFHRLMHAPNGDLKIYIDWRDNPTKNQGLYKLVNDTPVAIDPINNPLPPSYNPPTKEVVDLLSRLRKNGYELETKTRSPWLDRECDRGSSTPQNVAQEIERDYGGSVSRIFGEHCMKKAEEFVRTPDIVGQLSVYDDLTYAFDRNPTGTLKLWCQLDIQDKPPRRDYVVCADVATGDGGEFCSNSVIIVIDLQTREQVAEYATNTEKPTQLADRAIAMCKWFHGAYLAWEHGGPGTAFTTHVIERGYGYCYERTSEDRATKKRTKKLGFVNVGGARETLFGDLERLIRTGELIIHSKQLAEEFTQYIRGEAPKRAILHVATKSGDSSHGDRVIALGVGVQAMKDRPLQLVKGRESFSPTSEPEPGTMAYREWLHAQQETNQDDWDDRSTSDLRGSVYAYN